MEYLGVNQVTGNQTAAKEHGKHDHHHDILLPINILSGQKIGRQRGKEQIQHDADNNDVDRIEISAKHHRVFYHHPICLYTKPPGL